jgi:hypothetical protein
MKTINKFLTAMAGITFSISGCGQYTNIPAQYHIAGTSDLVATITYAGGTATVKEPKVTVKGEPGSIGATFESMDISYTSDIAAVTNVPVSFRVDSSALPDSTGNVTPSTNTFELPVISSKVIELGRRQSQGNISARVILHGTDDANWPSDLSVNVPIVFLQTSTATTP